MFVDAAIGIIVNSASQVVMALRQPHQVYAGFWEFPGGKVEPGEPIVSALKRELHEELGIEILDPAPLVCTAYQYPDRLVHIHAYLIQQYTGTVCGNEGQHVEWVNFDGIMQRVGLEANIPIIRALNDCYLKNLKPVKMPS